MFSTIDAMANKDEHLSSYILGYHIYNAIRSTTVREELQCTREVGNANNRCSGVLTNLCPSRLRYSAALISKNQFLQCMVVWRYDMWWHGISYIVIIATYFNQQDSSHPPCSILLNNTS